jgi:CheY-like chemotaxis protein
MYAGLLRRGRHIRLSVVDDGSGFDEVVARKLFTPFFTTKEDGTGLGLPSVLQIVTAHSGGIHIRTQPGVGTNFMILLPVAVEYSGEQAASAATTSVASSIPGMADEGAEIRSDVRILVVDDEDRLVELASAILTNLGYEVEGFTDPKAAAARFAESPDSFDLLFTDQTMPDLSGRELIDRLCRLRPDLNVVICTGYERDVERAGDVPPNVRFILRKPYAPADLAKTVRAALAAPAG